MSKHRKSTPNWGIQPKRSGKTKQAMPPSKDEALIKYVEARLTPAGIIKFRSLMEESEKLTSEGTPMPHEELSLRIQNLFSHYAK